MYENVHLILQNEYKAGIIKYQANTPTQHLTSVFFSAKLNNNVLFMPFSTQKFRKLANSFGIKFTLLKSTVSQV